MQCRGNTKRLRETGVVCDNVWRGEEEKRFEREWGVIGMAIYTMRSEGHSFVILCTR